MFFWNTESDILSKKNTFHLLTKEAHLHIYEGPVLRSSLFTSQIYQNRYSAKLIGAVYFNLHFDKERWWVIINPIKQKEPIYLYWVYRTKYIFSIYTERFLGSQDEKIATKIKIYDGCKWVFLFINNIWMEKFSFSCNVTPGSSQHYSFELFHSVPTFSHCIFLNGWTNTAKNLTKPQLHQSLGKKNS